MAASGVLQGPLDDFLTADHRRLDALLELAAANPAHVDIETFSQFREGLLRHIAMEEKVLLPAVRAARGGEPLPIAAELRLHHGAIAALLVPTPTHRIVQVLRAVLAAHNPLEEGPGGLYATCEHALGGECGVVLERVRAVPPVKVAAYNDDPRVLPAAAATLERAGFLAEARRLLEP